MRILIEANHLLVAPAFSSEESTTVTAVISTTRACVFTMLDVVAVRRPAGANLDISFHLTKHHDDEEEKSYSVESFVHFDLSYSDDFDCDWEICYWLYKRYSANPNIGEKRS